MDAVLLQADRALWKLCRSCYTSQIAWVTGRIVIVTVVASERLPFRNGNERFLASLATLPVLPIVVTNSRCELRYPVLRILKKVM